MRRAMQVSKNGLFAPFMHKNERFAKTGSGQTKGKLTKDYRLSQTLTAIVLLSDVLFKVGATLITEGM